MKSLGDDHSRYYMSVWLIFSNVVILLSLNHIYIIRIDGMFRFFCSPISLVVKCATVQEVFLFIYLDYIKSSLFKWNHSMSHCCSTLSLLPRAMSAWYPSAKWVEEYESFYSYRYNFPGK